jgi:chromosome partitioning protein
VFDHSGSVTKEYYGLYLYRRESKRRRRKNDHLRFPRRGAGGKRETGAARGPGSPGGADHCVRLHACKFPGIDLAPSNLDLAGAEAELIGEIGWDRFLRDALEPVLSSYDYVLLDCPPTLGILTTNALVAGHMVIVPIECEYLALQALKQLHTIVGKIRRKANPDLKIKVLRTKVDLRTTLGREVFEEIGRAGGDQVFQDIFIKKTIKFAESTAAGEPILLYATDSEVAQAYRNLAEELLHV